MPKIPDVVDGELIESAWGNQSIRDRTVQRMTNAADRDASIPSPGDGETVWLEDIGELQIWNGSTWVPMVRADETGIFLRLTGGVLSGFLQAANFVRIQSSAGEAARLRMISDAAGVSEFVFGLNEANAVRRMSVEFDNKMVQYAPDGGTAITVVMQEASEWGFRVKANPTTIPDNRSRWVRNVLVGTTIPSDSVGEDGDIYVRYTD